MNHLSRIHNNFLKKCTRIQVRASDAQKISPSKDSWRLRYTTEGLISDLWQLWSDFCRSLMHFSCRGAVCRDGTAVNARQGSNTWQRIGYEANYTGKRGGPRRNRSLLYRRQEPTWGDQNRVIDIIMRLKPSNEKHLLTAFGLPLHGPKHLQIVRNACFHKNPETLKQVRDLTMTYLPDKLLTPSDIAWFIDKSQSCCGIYAWCHDLSIIVSESTKKA